MTREADATSSRGIVDGMTGEVFQGDDVGLFGPGSVTWRVHAEPILAVAGLRALYLQALHPKAVAGVVQNSAYQKDPWGRLWRTIQYVGTVVYGTTAEVEREARRIRAMHARLRAVDPDTGDLFRIDEPELLRWVHVTEVESFLTTARRSGLPLSADEVDRYYDEQRRAGELVGLDPAGTPGSAAEVEAYYHDMRPGLRLTRFAAEAALFLTRPPLPRGLGLTPVRGMYFGLASLAIGLLPRWARRLYGLPGLSVTDLSASLSARTLRRTLALAPHRVYEGPMYRAAMARTARRADTADQPA